MKEVKSRSEKSSSPFTNPWYNHINSTKLLYKIVLISFLGIFCPRSRRIKSHFPCQNYNRSINTRKILPPLWNTLTCHHRGCMSKQLAYEFSTASILFLKSIEIVTNSGTVSWNVSYTCICWTWNGTSIT